MTNDLIIEMIAGALCILFVISENKLITRSSKIDFDESSPMPCKRTLFYDFFLFIGYKTE